MSDEGAEAIGTIFLFLGIAALVIAVIIFIIIPIIIISICIGSLVGGGYSIYNYSKAFGDNVRLEQP